LRGVNEVLEEWIRKVSGDNENKVWTKWEKKGKYLIVVIVCLGLLALIWSPAKSVPQEIQNAKIQNTSGLASAKANLTEELQNILSQVEGAGKVQVSLTLSSDGLKNYARNTKNDLRDTKELDRSGVDRNIKEDNQSSDIAVSSGTALLVEDRAPEVVGVLIVADGAQNGLVKEKLTDATSTLLNISPSQVRVLSRKGE
jgi:stage III sporulation protein AG